MIVTIIHLAAVIAICVGAFFTFVSNDKKDSELGERVMYLVGVRLITFGFIVVTIKAMNSDPVVLSIIPGVVVIYGILYDALVTPKVRMAIEEDKINNPEFWND
jgi:hypothetical protein